MKSLFDKLFLVKEIRSKEGVLHFRRWRFLELPFLRIYLHNILKSDEDKHEHDHPWGFFSLILKGGYVENVTRNVPGPFRSYQTECGPGSILHRRVGDSHRLICLCWNKPVWSLVVAYGKKRPWGYQTKDGWVQEDQYRTMKRQGKFEEANANV